VIYYKRFWAVLEMKKEKRLLLFLALVLVGVLLFSSVPASAGENSGRGKSLAEARKALEQELLPLAGAGFVGITHSEAEGEITVFVEDEQTKQRVPRSFEGYAVRTEVTGKIQAFSTQVAEPLTGISPARRGQVRPLVGGTSLSAYVPSVYYVGTLGMITYDNKILSNAHVIAMNPQTTEFLVTGTAILQPGSADGGLSNQVGVLEDYIPINFAPGAENYADAAIGSINVGVNASPGEQFSEGGNYWVGGSTEVSTGDIVRKSGRTTGVTTGEVLYTDYSGEIGYGGKSAYFVDQIVVAQENWSFAKPGDSGSAVDKDGKFVGLLFAGSAGYAVICKAAHIIAELGIAVEPPVGQYSLTISRTPGGNVTQPGVGTYIYDNNTVVDLVAVPDPHYHFVGWTGDVSTIASVNATSTNITMYDSYAITANFALDEGWYSLTISRTPGGNVTTPGEGTYVYGNYTTVDLVAEADAAHHYHFAEWTGNVSTIASVNATSTNITMDDSYSITANFELDPGWYSLTISSTDGGIVTEPGEGTHVYGNSTVVALVAVPATHYHFVEWTGDVGTIADVHSASTTITMDDSYSITANFETYPQPTVQLTVSSTTGGSVTTPGEGTFSYPLGAKVSLVAEAVSGYHFVNWSGDVGTIADINAASTTITMDSSYSIIANFSGAGGCFIATAAYGTPMAEEIGILREFRDEYLLTNAVGRALVDVYYRVSPPIAEFITEHPSLKPIVRAGLLPAVAMSTIAVNTTPVEKMVIVGLLVLVAVALAIWATRRRGRGPQYT
jgi:hypothetical protein